MAVRGRDETERQWERAVAEADATARMMWTAANAAGNAHLMRGAKTQLAIGEALAGAPEAPSAGESPSASPVGPGLSSVRRLRALHVVPLEAGEARSSKA